MAKTWPRREMMTEIEKMRAKLALFEELLKKVGKLNFIDLAEQCWAFLCSDGFIRRSASIGNDVGYIIYRRKGSNTLCSEEKSLTNKKGRKGQEIHVRVSFSEWNSMTENATFLGNINTGYDFSYDDYEIVCYND